MSKVTLEPMQYFLNLRGCHRIPFPPAPIIKGQHPMHSSKPSYEPQTTGYNTAAGPGSRATMLVVKTTELQILEVRRPPPRFIGNAEILSGRMAEMVCNTDSKAPKSRICVTDLRRGSPLFALDDLRDARQGSQAWYLSILVDGSTFPRRRKTDIYVRE